MFAIGVGLLAGLQDETGRDDEVERNSGFEEEAEAT